MRNLQRGSASRPPFDQPTHPHALLTPVHREVFFNDPESSQGRVYAGTVFDRPSADWLQIRFRDFSIKEPDLER